MELRHLRYSDISRSPGSEASTRFSSTALRVFAKGFPGVHVELQSMNTGSQIEALLKGRIQAGFSGSSGCGAARAARPVLLGFRARLAFNAARLKGAAHCFAQSVFGALRARARDLGIVGARCGLVARFFLTS